MTSSIYFRKFIAEALGTFALVFCGTGAIIANEITGGGVTHVGIAVTFGLIVSGMVFSFGGISGAHLNPAVTIAFWIAGKFPKTEILLYVVAQLLGAFLASGLLKFLFPQSTNLGSTLPSGTELQSFILEIILTFLLMTVILNTATESKEKGMLAGIAVGSTVLLEAMFAGPISGASMNPARSIAPAVLSGVLEHLWIYIVAPVTGAALSVFVWEMTKEKIQK
jgi:aquaporin NIP